MATSARMIKGTRIFMACPRIKADGRVWCQELRKKTSTRLSPLSVPGTGLLLTFGRGCSISTAPPGGTGDRRVAGGCAPTTLAALDRGRDRRR
jgi:hypothetical protein